MSNCVKASQVEEEEIQLNFDLPDEGKSIRVIVLSEKQVLLPCGTFEIEFLLDPQNIDNLWTMASNNEIVLCDNDIKRFQDQLRQVVAERFA